MSWLIFIILHNTTTQSTHHSSPAPASIHRWILCQQSQHHDYHNDIFLFVRRWGWWSHQHQHEWFNDCLMSNYMLSVVYFYNFGRVLTISMRDVELAFFRALHFNISSKNTIVEFIWIKILIATQEMTTFRFSSLLHSIISFRRPNFLHLFEFVSESWIS